MATRGVEEPEEQEPPAAPATTVEDGGGLPRTASRVRGEGVGTPPPLEEAAGDSGSSGADAVAEGGVGGMSPAAAASSVLGDRLPPRLLLSGRGEGLLDEEPRDFPRPTGAEPPLLLPLFSRPLGPLLPLFSRSEPPLGLLLMLLDPPAPPPVLYQRFSFFDLRCEPFFSGTDRCFSTARSNEETVPHDVRLEDWAEDFAEEIALFIPDRGGDLGGDCGGDLGGGEEEGEVRAEDPVCVAEEPVCDAGGGAVAPRRDEEFLLGSSPSRAGLVLVRRRGPFGDDG